MIFSRVYTFALTALVVISAFLFHLNPDNFLADDAYFYPQIADQIVQGHGSTFHQYSFTNGYQPLWMVFNVIAAGVAQGDKVLLLHLLGIVQVGLFLITIYYLFQVTVTAQLRFYGVGLAILTVLMLVVGGLRLFEAHLAIALQMAALYLFLWLWQNNPTTNSLAATSVLLGLIFLARTDAFFFSMSYGIALGLMILNEAKPLYERIFRIIITALPAILIAMAYMSFNNAAFGHPVPISGVIKSSYPHIHVDWSALGMQGQYIVGITLVLLALAIVLSSHQKSLQVLFSVAFVSVLLHAAYIICFSWGSQWYYTTAFTVLPVALQFLITYVYRHISYIKTFRFFVCTMTLVCLSFMVTVGYLKTYYNFSISLLALGKETFKPVEGKSPRLQLVDAVNANIAPGEGIAVFDSPGVLAYFTHARILPLDGLVNDQYYDQYIVKEGIRDYLRKSNVRYFIGANLPDGNTYRSATLLSVRDGSKQYNTVFAPVQKVQAGSFSVADKDIIFSAPNPIPGNHSFDEVCCWKLRV